MQHMNSLPDETRSLLQLLSQQDGLEGFILVGGTALALRNGHRTSQDIDLAWDGGKLPRDRIHRLLHQLSPHEEPTDIMDQFQKDLVTNDGLDLDDYHQDWRVKDTKITFFAPDAEGRDLPKHGGTEKLGNLAVANDDAIFRMKARVILARQTSRDYFDLWYFMNHQGRSVSEILAEMRKADPHHTVDAHLLKLGSPKISPEDPLWETVLPGAPQSPQELIEALGKDVDRHRRELAKNAALQEQHGRNHGR